MDKNYFNTNENADEFIR